jgi:hypothetical protein
MRRSGCIRLTNRDVKELHSRVNVRTRVVLLPGLPPISAKTMHNAQRAFNELVDLNCTVDVGIALSMLMCCRAANSKTLHTGIGHGRRWLYPTYESICQ